MSKIWSIIKAGFKAIFCRETISKVWTILFNSGKSTVGGILSNTDLMNAAFEYAKALATNNTTSDAKKESFNSLMTAYLKNQGIEVGTSVLNIVREMALAAVNAEAEQTAN